MANRKTRHLLIAFFTLVTACTTQNTDDEAVKKIQEASPVSVYQGDASSLNPMDGGQTTKEPVSQADNQSATPENPLEASQAPEIDLPETSTATPSPKEPIFASMSKNSFCREGPGSTYRDMTAVPAEDEIEVRGISEDTYWLFIYWAKFNVECWVVASSVALDITPGVLPVVISSALPEATDKPKAKDPPAPVQPTATSKKP